MLDDHYGPEFYSRQIDGSARSARVILQLLYDVYRPLSVVDVGCGRGSWLATAESLGSVKLKGLDGTWAEKAGLLSKNIDFAPVDFENDVEIAEHYDLCISVEVAEHLSEARAKRFINTLCKSSDVVLFSAAIKQQGGTHHVNEQWQSYWISLFDANGYECLDILRPAIWKNAEVEWWYRQNIFLFVRRGSTRANLAAARSMVVPIADIVHPENFEHKIRSHKQMVQRMLQYPSLAFCLRCMKRYVAVKLERLTRPASET